MAGLWPVRRCGVSTEGGGPAAARPRRVAVRPSVRPSPATAGAVPWAVRGSARCTGSSGLGDTAAYIPAGGGSVREAGSASRTVRRPGGARGHVRSVPEPALAAPIWPKIDHASRRGFPLRPRLLRARTAWPGSARGAHSRRARRVCRRPDSGVPPRHPARTCPASRPARTRPAARHDPNGTDSGGSWSRPSYAHVKCVSYAFEAYGCSTLSGDVRGGAPGGANAAPPPFRRASFVAAW
jgi:hypothetical protein